MLIGALAMVGIIPFAGFWAKDEIIGAAFVKGYYFVWAVAMVTVVLTGIYVFRLIFMTFWGESRADAEVQHHIHESPPVMTVPLIILAIPAAGLGLLVGLPPEGGWLHTFLEPVFFESEHHPFTWIGEGGALMGISLIAALVGIYIAWRYYVRDTAVPGRLAGRVPLLYKASYNKMYMDEIYEVVPIRATIGLSVWLWRFVDATIIDGAVNGVARIWGWVGAGLRPIQTGRVQNYAMYVFAGMVALVVVLAWVWGA
jgi:NADH-quinone oxidoreductase subunit L